MTLVVADIYDVNRIAMASDTRIGGGPGCRASRPSHEEFAKLVILRSTLAVGIAGSATGEDIDGLLSMHDASISDLVGALEGNRHAEYVVASLDPLRLLRVADGMTEDLTEIGQAWVGDDGANDRYQHRLMGGWADLDTTVPFRQMTAMQATATWNSVPTAGGHAVRLDGGSEGFQFLPDYQINLDSDDSTVFFAGTGATPGAFGLFYADHGFGLLFHHEDPDAVAEIAASSTSELVEVARAQHGQYVTQAMPSSPWKSSASTHM